jgi:hypothetical protein
MKHPWKTSKQYLFLTSFFSEKAKGRALAHLKVKLDQKVPKTAATKHLWA